MNKKLNIGILGCANIATRSVIPEILNLSDNYSLFGIASRNTDKAEKCAAEFNTKGYGSYESLLSEKELDAVYIPLPNSLHAEWIDYALDKGVNVLVEKSLACSHEQVKRLNDKAREKNLVLVENFQFRFHSQLNSIKEIVESGKIGDIRCVRSSFGFPPFPDADNIRYKKELGGGALLDAGAYPIKISQILLGEDLKISSARLFYDDKTEVDIWGGGFAEQKNGNLFCEFAFGFDHYYQCNVEVWGSKGKLYTNRIFTAKPGFEPTVDIELQAGKETITLEQDNHFQNMLTHFYNLIQSKENLDAEYNQNINQARLIEEFRTIADGK